MVYRQQASAYHNLEEIEVIGSIVYVGPDPAVQQTSTMFGGSPNLRSFITSSQVDLAGFLDHLTTAIKYVIVGIFTAWHLMVLGRARDLHRFGWRMPMRVEPDSLLDTHEKETPRERDRCIFTAMMMEQLGKLFILFNDHFLMSDGYRKIRRYYCETGNMEEMAENGLQVSPLYSQLAR